MKRFIYFSGARRSIVGHGMVTPASAIGFAAAAPAAIPPAQHSVYLRGSVRDTGDSSSVASMSSSLSMLAAMATSGGPHGDCKAPPSSGAEGRLRLRWTLRPFSVSSARLAAGPAVNSMG
jgi:hypothetical protein